MAGIRIVGTLRAVLTENGRVVDTREVKNLVVNTGKAYMADRMVVGTTPQMLYFGIGTGTTAASATDTALQAQIRRDIDFGAVQSTTATTHDTLVVTSVYDPGPTISNITEAALFNDPTAGIMFNRAVFASITKSAIQTLTITWTLVFS